MIGASEQWEEERPPVTSVEGKPLSARGKKTRQRLLEAAEQVFGDMDYHAASMVKITEAAGVAQGTSYRYFDGKLDIFEHLVRELNHEVRRAMSEASRRGATRAEAERLGFQAFFRFTEEHPKLYRIIRQSEFVAPREHRRHYEKIAAGYVAGLKRAMRDGEVAAGDPEVLAYALMGIGELVGMRWIVWDAGAMPDEVFEETTRFITRGLGADAEGSQ
jgi:AcrR family transcriptional regulator